MTEHTSPLFKNAKQLKRLRHYTWFAEIVCAGIFLLGLLFAILFFVPEAVGVPEDKHGSVEGQWIWLGAGILFMLFGLIAIPLSGRWYRHIVWIYYHVTPVEMTLYLEILRDQDSFNDYVATLGDSQGHKWEAKLLTPAWSVRNMTEKVLPVQVYIDPKTESPAIVETPTGLLWVRSIKVAD